MMKLKLAAAVLALIGMTSLLMGGSYLTVVVAVICTATALPLSLHLTFRWFVEDSHDGLLWFWSVVWVIMSVMAAASVLQNIGAVDVPLSATIDNTQKIGDVGQYVSSTNIVSILLSVVIPRSSPKRSDDDNKG